jgi:aminopeptidase-like protein
VTRPSEGTLAIVVQSVRWAHFKSDEFNDTVTSGIILECNQDNNIYEYYASFTQSSLCEQVVQMLRLVCTKNENQYCTKLCQEKIILVCITPIQTSTVT